MVRDGSRGTPRDPFLEHDMSKGRHAVHEIMVWCIECALGGRNWTTVHVARSSANNG